MSNGFVCTGNGIELFRLRALIGAIELEGKGIKLSRGVSALSIAKRDYGLKGNRATILIQLKNKFNELGARIQPGEIREI